MEALVRGVRSVRARVQRRRLAVGLGGVAGVVQVPLLVVPAARRPVTLTVDAEVAVQGVAPRLTGLLLSEVVRLAEVDVGVAARGEHGCARAPLYGREGQAAVPTSAVAGAVPVAAALEQLPDLAVRQRGLRRLAGVGRGAARAAVEGAGLAVEAVLQDRLGRAHALEGPLLLGALLGVQLQQSLLLVGQLPLLVARPQLAQLGGLALGVRQVWQLQLGGAQRHLRRCCL